MRGRTDVGRGGEEEGGMGSWGAWGKVQLVICEQGGGEDGRAQGVERGAKWGNVVGEVGWGKLGRLGRWGPCCKGRRGRFVGGVPCQKSRGELGFGLKRGKKEGAACRQVLRGRTWRRGEVRAVGEKGGRRRRGFWLFSAAANFVLAGKEDLAQPPRWVVGGVFKKVERQRPWDGEREEVILGQEEERREERENL